MKTQEINYPNDSIVIVHCLEPLPGGRSLNVEQYEKATIDAGTVVYKEGEKYFPLSGAKVYEAAAATVQEIKAYKGSCSLKASLEIKSGLKLVSIDSSNEAYTFLSSTSP